MSESFTLRCLPCEWTAVTDSLTNAEFASDFHVDRNHSGHTVSCYEGEPPACFYSPKDPMRPAVPVWTVRQAVCIRPPTLPPAGPEDEYPDFRPDDSTD